MGAGKYRHRITIQQLTTSKGSLGGVVKTWSTFATVRAQVLALSGREFWQSKQVNADTTHKVTIRYLSGVLPTMRIVFDGRILEIESIIPDERKREMVLMCVDRGEVV